MILVVAIVFGMINVVGGFLVTDRMLAMFKPKKSPSATIRAEGGPAVTVVVPLLYIVAFALFILGLSGLTGPRTAVRGNKIAAVGMLVAVLATLLTVRHNWLLIIVGLVVGAALGVPSARRVRMTAMPQMVALFNGVGGGAVALIAWSEFRTTDAFAGEPLYVVIASLFGAIVGSVSFWGSLVAFGKLQEILPGRPLGLGPGPAGGEPAAARGAAACATSAAIGGAELWMIGLLVLAAVLGVMVVLPIGGADMPVVISLLNALTGLSAAAAGLALGNTAMIVAGMIVGASGTILTNLMATAMNRSIPAIVAGGFGGTSTAPSADDAADRHVTATTAADAAVRMAYASQVIVVPGYGMAVAQAQHAVKDMAGPAGGARRRGQVRDPPGGRPHARAHERAARRGRRALRRAPRDGRDQRRVPADRRRRWSSARTTSPTPPRAPTPDRRSTACRSSTSTAAAR